MRIRLIRKLADIIDEVKIADYVVGDVIDLPDEQARLLIAERWAVPLDDSSRREVRRSTSQRQVAEAADSNRRNALEHLRRASRLIDERRVELPHGRRREDIIIDELRDSRARTLRKRDD